MKFNPSAARARTTREDVHAQGCGTREARLPAHPPRRRRPPDHVALRRPVRPPDAGAVGPRRGARAGGAAGGRGRAATPTSGRRGRTSCWRPSTRPASPRPSWSPSTAASSRAPRTWRWRWSPSSWPGWTPARPPCSLAGNLGLAPIHERGTPEQRAHYMSLAAPPKPGEDRKPWRGAFALTEPIPYVGRGDRHARRQGARGRVEGGRGADPPGRQARPLHHQHGLRQLRHRRGRLGRPAHQGQLHGHPRGGRPGHLRPRRRPPGSWCTSSPRRATRSSA